jgi:hypothetical protein
MARGALREHGSTSEQSVEQRVTSLISTPQPRCRQDSVWYRLVRVRRIHPCVNAVRRRNFPLHGEWMIRAYAIGLGAGTQVLTHLPWFMLVDGRQGELPRTVMMGAGWIINVLVAEWIIRSRTARPRPMLATVGWSQGTASLPQQREPVVEPTIGREDAYPPRCSHRLPGERRLTWSEPTRFVAGGASWRGPSTALHA